MSNPNPEIGQRITANGVSTNYHDVGSGEVVLLLHGSGPGVSAWANWRTTMPVLSQRFRIIAPDLLGFGYTARLSSDYSLDAWVAHVIAVMDALNVQRFHVAGNSFGGALALALATRHPDRVGRLVLMGSVGVEFEITPGLEAVWGYEPSVENMRGLLDIFAYDRKLVTDELAKLRFVASTQPGVQEAFAAMFPAPRQRHLRSLATDKAKLSALSNPALVIHGRDDQVIPLNASLELAATLPNAELHVFPECGHWVQIEKAGRFNKLITDFFEGA